MEFTDLSEINTLDLNKLPPDDDSTDLWYWMKFIKSDDEGVMDMLATRSPQMRKAVGVLKELSADEAMRLRYEARERARRDEESRRDEDVLKAKIEIAKKLLVVGDSVDKIVMVTGLTHAEVEKTRDANK